MLISSSIPNFVNGVSQQPFTLRLVSQGEEQVNGYSTVSQGLKKRPPTEHIAKVTSSPLGDAYVHTINRDASERYVAAILDGDLKVYDLEGNAKTVTFPDGKGYLDVAGSPAKKFSVISIADYTFIVNKEKVVAMGSTVKTARPYEALVNVKSGNYGKTYKIIINGTTRATYTTNNGGSAADSATIDTTYIANQLCSGLSASGITNTRIGSAIYITNSTDFTITTEDGFNNNAMVAIKRQIQKFSDLPTSGYSGFLVEVVGDGSEAFDNYWVEYDTTNGTGVWREAMKDNIKVGFDASTMPHVLIRNSDGTFTFKKATWDTRKVGDEESNPENSFIGTTISDVFFFRNRLGFLADESAIFSEAGNYWNFFRTTVTTLLDGDPIDVTASATKVTFLKHAVQFNKQLLLFSDQTQFLVDVQDLLTPKTIALKMTTEFPCNTDCKPVPVGRNVYFTVTKGDHAAVKEYYADNNNYTNDALDVTAHVPQYVDGPIYKIAAGANEDVLVLLSEGERNALYIYKYFWANNEKLQSSWSEWSFPETDTILGAEFIQSDLYLFINRADGMYFEKINFAVNNTNQGEPYQVKLDRKKHLPADALTYSSGYTYINTTVLGYTPNDGDYAAVVLEDQDEKPGEVYNVQWTGTQARIAGNIAGNAIAFGRKYTFKYTLSTITVKTAQVGGGTKSDTEGRLQLRKIALNYDQAGYFVVKVTPQARDTYNYVYSGKVIGTSSATVGAYSISQGRMIVPVVSRNIGTTITVENDSPLPCSLLSADWEGYYVKRSRQV